MKGPISKIDLCKRENQELILEFIKNKKVDAIMVAPPCGTSSRAREIVLFSKGKLLKRQPRPLRSTQFPDGLPTLSGLATIKVRLANKLYRFARSLLDLAVSLNIPIIIENPKRSYMWLTSSFRHLPEGRRFQHIHSCMYGGTRLKRTSFLMNFHAANLLLECDGSHNHLPWGQLSDTSSTSKFATSTETEYPWNLRKALALAFQLRLQELDKPIRDMAHKEFANRMGAGVQPRGHAREGGPNFGFWSPQISTGIF